MRLFIFLGMLVLENVSCVMMVVSAGGESNLYGDLIKTFRGK